MLHRDYPSYYSDVIPVKLDLTSPRVPANLSDVSIVIRRHFKIVPSSDSDPRLIVVPSGCLVRTKEQISLMVTNARI